MSSRRLPGTGRFVHMNWELLGFSVAATVFGFSFGVVAVANEVDPLMTVVLSATVFGAGAQFAALGIVLAGGSASAAVVSGLLLNTRLAAFGLAVRDRLRLRGVRRALAAAVMLDAPVLLALNEPDPAQVDRVYLRTGITVYSLWVGGTVAGITVGQALGDPNAIGLDVALPAMFVALLRPALRSRRARVSAAVGGAIALVLLPVTPPGVPVLAAIAGAAVASRVPAGSASSPGIGGAA